MRKGKVLTVVLAIDTSFQGLSLALWSEDKGILGYYQSDSLRDQARLLHPEAKSLLADQNMTINNVDAMMVTKGPGSFTGVRLSLAAAKAFKLATDAELYSVTTHEAVALKTSEVIDSSFWVCLEAGRDKLFAQKFDADARALTEIQTYLQDDFLNVLEKGDILVGQSALKLYDRLPEGVENMALANEDLRLPQAQNFIKHFSKELSQEEEPLYIQPLTYRKTYGKDGKPLESFSG